MSYYFPYGATSAISVQNISHSLQAITASRPDFANITIAPTSSYAPSVQSSPAAGGSGFTPTIVDCAAGPIGPIGPTGPSGSKGTNYSGCPAGTKECPALNVSLSLYVNPNRASGSQFTIVCIDTYGRLASEVECPSYLPTASVSKIPAIPAP